MKIKGKINYWIDIVIGIAFILSAVSGLVLLFAGNGGGYQGGRNPAYRANVALISRDLWKDLHNWGSILMVAGVLGHLVLHWNWMVCMTRNMFKKDTRKRSVEPCPVEA